MDEVIQTKETEIAKEEYKICSIAVYEKQIKELIKEKHKLLMLAIWYNGMLKKIIKILKKVT